MTHKSLRIAVVDDDVAVRNALMRLLEASFCEVQTFVSARELLSSLAADIPECMIVDLQMPEMSGLELQHYLGHKGIHIPTIVITAHDEPGNREKCIAAGAAAYLLKPLRKSVLMDAIHTATGRGN
jgi:FixJ family two-component response regulator